MGSRSCRFMYPPWNLVNQYRRENWMTEMSETISETRLIDLKLPGTHDSASYSCNEYVAMCQNADIKEQLLRGIRFLDIRIGWDFVCRPGGVRVGHGKFSWGTSFENIISDIYDFVSTHPREFIIILNGKAAGLENNDKSFIKDQYTLRLGEWMVKAEDNFELSIVKSKDLWEKNRRLWVFNDDWNEILNIDEITGKQLGLWPMSPYLFGKYANTTNNDIMYNEINSQLSSGTGLDSFLLHFLTLTPGDFQAVASGVQPLTLDLQVPNSYFTWFKEHYRIFRINIVIMDFVFGASDDACRNQLDFLDLIIYSNDSNRPKSIKNQNNEYLCKLTYTDYIDDCLFSGGRFIVSNPNISNTFWVFENMGDIFGHPCFIKNFVYFNTYIECLYLSTFDTNNYYGNKVSFEKDAVYACLVKDMPKAKLWVVEDIGNGFVRIKEETSRLYLLGMGNRDKDSKFVRLSNTYDAWKIE